MPVPLDTGTPSSSSVRKVRWQATNVTLLDPLSFAVFIQSARLALHLETFKPNTTWALGTFPILHQDLSNRALDAFGRPRQRKRVSEADEATRHHVCFRLELVATAPETLFLDLLYWASGDKMHMSHPSSKLGLAGSSHMIRPPGNAYRRTLGALGGSMSLGFPCEK